MKLRVAKKVGNVCFISYEVIGGPPPFYGTMTLRRATSRIRKFIKRQLKNEGRWRYFNTYKDTFGGFTYPDNP